MVTPVSPQMDLFIHCKFGLEREGRSERR